MQREAFDEVAQKVPIVFRGIRAPAPDPMGELTMLQCSRSGLGSRERDTLPISPLDAEIWKPLDVSNPHLWSFNLGATAASEI